MSLLHDVVAGWKLLAIALDMDMEAGRTSGSVSCEYFMSGDDPTLDTDEGKGRHDRCDC